MGTILDPTDERVPVSRQISPRSGQVTGIVGLMDIRKPRGDVLLDELERLFTDRLPGIVTPNQRSPNLVPMICALK
jgi:hypothetical protein